MWQISEAILKILISVQLYKLSAVEDQSKRHSPSPLREHNLKERLQDELLICFNSAVSRGACAHGRQEELQFEPDLDT